MIPGLDGSYKPYGSAYAVYMRSYQGWTRDRDSNHDFGLITLDRSIGNSTGWFGYASYASVNGLTANLGGYPGDLDNGLRLYYHSGPITSSTTDRVYYTIDTAGGQSGSSVYPAPRIAGRDSGANVCGVIRGKTHSVRGTARYRKNRNGQSVGESRRK